jgi:hypothetical protein
MKSETYAALVNVASALVDNATSPELTPAFKSVSDWQELAAQAEIHGLSVMLGRLSANGDIKLPREFDLQLKALTIRHKKILAARRIVLVDVIDLFEQNHIDFAFLKGAALANLIYDPPWLRPMRDIDILVKGEDALKAQQLLRDIDFSNEDYAAGYLFEHHHLPNSIRIQDGFTISLEVHHDALSGDVDASITLDSLASELQSFDFAGKTAFAFGHTEMLKHLCFHTFEPAKVIKLGSMVDMVRYANHFVNEIDWPGLEATQPYTVNALRCIHALITLPSPLRDILIEKRSEQWQPAQKGEGFIPLSQISRLPRKQDKFHALLIPSEWWMHIFYAVPPGKSLFFTRLVRHPAMLSRWLFRRYRAAEKSRSL